MNNCHVEPFDFARDRRRRDISRNFEERQLEIPLLRSE
jgi:hypothetical protein